ncbi:MULTISPECIES: hypothetical protein [Ralstonia solanacearum species complex]|nr:hypothetical protein [Ralstonia solanacearum]
MSLRHLFECRQRLKSYVLYKSVEKPNAPQQAEHHHALEFLFLIFQKDTNHFPYRGKFFPIMKGIHGAPRCAIFADQNIFPHYEKWGISIRVPQLEAQCTPSEMLVKCDRSNQKRLDRDAPGRAVMVM